MSTPDASTYAYDTAGRLHHHAYLLPIVERLLGGLRPRRVLDLGCGSGAVAARLSALGYEVVGVDPSEEGIALGQAAYPHLALHVGSAYDDLAARFGRFPAVVSLEVVEHVYAPRSYAATLFDLTEPGGAALVSTPYHGYWKNLALALTGKWDAHLSPLWDHGHIKFWSERTLRALLEEAGFEDVRFERVGRVPALAKSMIAVARKPVAG